MEDPVVTPRQPPTTTIKSNTLNQAKEQLLSSSPGFGTPAYPIANRPPPVPRPFAPQKENNVAPSVLPILLPPHILRPVAFRTLTKKHNLTLTSPGLGLLSTFVGKFCGSGWREDGLAERVLDEVAKTWKRSGGNVLVEDGPDKKLTAILKSLEPCMSAGRLDIGRLSRTNSSIGGPNLSRQTSLDLRPAPNREDSQASIGVSSLEIDDTIDEEDSEALAKQDARSYMKVISAFDQPRLTYSMTKKSMEADTSAPSLLPRISHKTAHFRNRYNLVHQRLMRNESFQTPSFSMAGGPPHLSRSASKAATMQQAYKITPVSNLLGRSGTYHLLLGTLIHAPTGDLAVTDLSGSVVLDLSSARPVPEDGVWFSPGMMVLIEGIYEEDGSNNSSLGGVGGVGGQIKGKFVGETIAGPPAEKREVTLGSGQSAKSEDMHTSVGAGFGWVDFLGVGSEKAVGARNRRIRRTILGRDRDAGKERSVRTRMAIIGECCLDIPRTLDAIRAVLNTYNSSGAVEDRPLTVVLMGNFVSSASMAGSSKGGGSIEYKEYFDSLASVLSEFPALLSNSTFVFVPGDNDPWASSFSAGGAVAIPREAVPEIFTSRIRRAFASANTEAGRKDIEGAGEAIWTSNPARVSLFGPVDELVLFRDDITGRLRRSAVTFTSLPKQEAEEEFDPIADSQRSDEEAMELDTAVQEATSHIPKAPSKTNDADTATARKLVKTILDQGHLSPFPLSSRPVFWNFGSSLTLYPLPTALVLADAEAPAFAVTYEGCHVINPGRVIDELGLRKGIARWLEYDIKGRRGVVREVRF